MRRNPNIIYADLRTVDSAKKFGRIKDRPLSTGASWALVGDPLPQQVLSYFGCAYGRSYGASAFEVTLILSSLRFTPFISLCPQSAIKKHVGLRGGRIGLGFDVHGERQYFSIFRACLRGVTESQEPPRPPSPGPTVVVYKREAINTTDGSDWSEIPIRLVGSHPLWGHHL